MYNGEKIDDQPVFDIFHAASIGDSQFVKHFILSSDPNVVSGDEGWTPLMCASHYGHFGVVRMLLEAGADPNTSDISSGRTALMLACANGHTRCVEFLVNIGEANVKQTDKCGNTAANYAQQNGHGGNKLIADALGVFVNNGRRTPRHTPREVGTPRRSDKSRKLNPNVSPFTPSQASLNEQKLIKSPFDISSLFTPRSSEQPRASTPSITTDFFLTPSKTQNGSFNLSELIPATSFDNTFNITQAQEAPKSINELLQQLDLTQYQQTFNDNSVDLVSFQYMGDNELVNIGITSYSHRQKLKSAQEQVRNSFDTSNMQRMLLKYSRQQEQINALKIEVRELKQLLSNFARTSPFNQTVTFVK